MSRDSMDVITSSSAEEIRTYCQDLAQELEITLGDACWEYTFAGLDHRIGHFRPLRIIG